MTPTDTNHLIITTYVDTSPDTFDSGFMRAVPVALAAAARRVDEPRTSTITETTETGVFVHGGVDLLSGADVRWSGTGDLTTLKIKVPWTTEDGIDGRKLLAANRFAQALSAAVRVAA